MFTKVVQILLKTSKAKKWRLMHNIQIILKFCKVLRMIWEYWKLIKIRVLKFDLKIGQF